MLIVSTNSWTRTLRMSDHFNNRHSRVLIRRVVDFFLQAKYIYAHQSILIDTNEVKGEHVEK